MTQKIMMWTALLVIILITLTGCGSGSNVGPTSIQGIVVIENVPQEGVTVKLYNNGTFYTTTTDESGYFSYDEQYCANGNRVSIIFESSEILWGHTAVIDYTVKKGVNEIGQIDLSNYGFGSLAPGADQSINRIGGEFRWTPYNRPGFTPTYVLHTFDDEVKLQGTSYTLDGTEVFPSVPDGFSHIWTVSAEYNIRPGVLVRHYLKYIEFYLVN